MGDYIEYGDQYDDQYDSDGRYEMEELRVRLGNLLLMTGVVLVGLLLLLILWRLCFSDETEGPTKLAPGNPQAVYAHEIEPGFVVLQSQDGQFFRILQEYSEAKWNTASSNPASGRESRGNLTRSDSNSTWRPLSHSDQTVYTPHYTSAHYQTQPTAPLSASPLPYDQLATRDEELFYFDSAEVHAPQPPPYH